MHSKKLIDNLNKAVITFYALSPDDYDAKLFHNVAVGFKLIIADMEKGSSTAFPMFTKWLKLYVRLQHQVDPRNKNLFKKFEKKIPVCTSYIMASLQFQTKIANYHFVIMEMCLSLFDSASEEIMKAIANMDMEIIALLWMPIEFVGHYNTQKLSLRLIVKILKYLDVSGRRKKVTEIETSQNVRNMLLRLTAEESRFEKISRDLLNTFNMRTTKNCAVFSVHCTTALFNSFELFKPQACDRLWIDFNYASKTVSVLCQIQHIRNERKELSIEIKIDKLQIENQCDCIVISNCPATFSEEVPNGFKTAGIAVFTLPKTEFERLKANRDLLDFYNKTYCSSCTESNPNTIENYLAETNDDGFSDVSSRVPLSQNRSFKPSCTESHVSSTTKSNLTKSPVEDRNIELVRDGNVSRATNSMKGRSSVKVVIDKSAKETSRRVLLPKESGYNSSIADSTVFKKPNKPVRLKSVRSVPSEKENISLKEICPVQSKTQTSRKSPTQELVPPAKPPRKFFKSGGVQLSKNRTKPRRKRRTNTGCSPIRKQVNTSKPLKHLTEPVNNPNEAAVEFVENGGYSNIRNYVESTAGLQCFSDSQRKHILENIEKINEDLQRSAQRFFPKCLDSDSEVDSIWTTARNTKTKAPKVRDFVPYTVWKKKQKEKTNGQSTMLYLKEQPIFDQLKTASQSNNSLQKTTVAKANSTQVVDARDASSNSSVSSFSNHNFHINDSGNELDNISVDEGNMLDDMVCRREPEAIAESPVSVPAKSYTEKDVGNSSVLQVDMNRISQSDPDKILDVTAVECQSSYQVSEIFEDLDDIPELATTKPMDHSEPQEVEILSIHSSSSSEQPTVRCSQPVASINLETAPCNDPSNDWHIERYLNDQQYYNQASVASNPPLITSQSTQIDHAQPHNVTTNQVIIQNQFVMSTCRKRLLPVDNNETPLAKMCTHSDKRIPLRGYAQLLPNYMKQVTMEKDRLLGQLEKKLHENFFNHFSEIANDVMKSIADNEVAINEAQEQLSFICGKLEWLIDNQQKNKTQLENIYYQLIQRIKASLPVQGEVEEMYENAAKELRNFATEKSNELWENFADGVVSCIEGRMKTLIHL